MSLANRSLTPDLRPTERVTTPLFAAMFLDFLILKYITHRQQCEATIRLPVKSLRTLHFFWCFSASYSVYLVIAL